MTREPRPRMYPAPEFPPRKPALFARLPPSVFPAVLGLLGLGLALRRGLAELGLPGGLAEAFLGAFALLWAFAALAYAAKLARRPAVLIEEFGVLPARGGVASASVGAMAVAVTLAPYAPGLAQGVLWVAMALHLGQALVWVAALRRQSPPARRMDPTVHLTWVGFIVGAVAAADLGLHGLAVGTFWAVLPVAVLIWVISAVQLWREVPAAPLRPLLAIHLAPASLLALVAAATGMHALAVVFVGIGSVIFVALIAALRWLTVSGFSPMWGAFTFPVGAFASALLAVGWVWPGLVVLILALGAVPAIAWHVLKMWPDGSLAARTNAMLA